MSTFSRFAFDLSKDSIRYYLTVMSADEIFQFSKVSRVDEDPDIGYQRLLNEKRAEAIADYLNEGNVIPGAIILSAQNGANLSFDTNTNLLTMELKLGSLFVIDGQHRLYGSKKANSDIKMPVCILGDLDHSAEVRYFLDINSTQKGVPKTLRIELMKFLSEPDSIDAIRNKLFKDFNEMPDSPLFGRMSATVAAPGRLSLVPFQAAIDNIINGDILGQFTFEDKKKLLLNYLSAVEATLQSIEPNSNRLSTSAFFQAIFKIFEKVCHLSVMRYRNYSLASMMSVLEGINGIDFEKHSGSNQAAINDLVSELSTMLDIHSQKLGTPSGLL